MFRNRRADADLDRELRGYVELLTEEKIRAGMAPNAARRAALLEAGGVESVKENVRDGRRGASLETLLQDMRYAVRTLRNAPAFTTAAVLTLAIGIGANTAIFSAVDGVLLKPFPFSHTERIVTLFQNDRKKGIEREDVAPGNFASWRERARAFAAMAAAEPYGLAYETPEGPERLGNWNVTQDFFKVLDARPVRGRLLHDEDFTPGNGHVLILTYDSWQRRFGGQDSVIGRALRVGSDLYTIVGVLPRNFAYLGHLKRYEVFSPKTLDTSEVNFRASGWYHVVARLKPGVTVAQAAADLDRVADQLSTEYPATNTLSAVTVVPLRDGVAGNAARALFLLLGAVGLVLLIACTNVANLLLARTARRAREFAVRTALGAGPRRITRQVLTESFLLAAVGGLFGTLLAYWGVGAIRSISPGTLPRVEEMRVDARALLFALGAVVLTTFVFGLFPALRAADPSSQRELTSGARAAGSPRQHRLRGLLVIAEVALAIVLLVGAGLLMRSFVLVTGSDRGYRSDHVLASTTFIWSSQRTPSARRQFVTELVARAAAIPGVEAAAVSTSIPLADRIGADQAKFGIVGQAVARGEEPAAHVTALTPDAFAVLRMQLRAGRLLTAHDDSAALPVAVISESMARRYWPNENPLGRRISLGFYAAPVVREVVGVVADIRHASLDAPPEATVYLPHAQAPVGDLNILVRTRDEPRGYERQIKRVVASLDPSLTMAGTRTLDEIANDSLKARRFALVLFGCFAAAALLLAIIGVYGVVSHSTAERSKEFGVRLALGAQRSDIIRMVVGQGLATAAFGLAIGTLAAAGLTSLMANMLFGVTPLDPLTFGGVAALMLATVLVACYIPARRATAVPPVTALRLS